MNFDNKIPEWKNEGIEPTDELKEKGFTGGYKPPATVFNWFWCLVQKCITELQNKLKTHDIDTSIALDDKLSKTEGGTVNADVTFNKNLITKDHISSASYNVGNPVFDIDMSGNSFELGTRDSSYIGNWLSYLEFNNDGNLNVRTNNTCHLFAKANLYQIAASGILLAAGYMGSSTDPTIVETEILNHLPDPGSNINWDSFNSILNSDSVAKIVAGMRLYLASPAVNINSKKYRNVSTELQRIVLASTTSAHEAFEEDIDESNGYRSHVNSQHTIRAKNDIYLVPGNTKGNENSTPDGAHYVRASNIKGYQGGNSEKPTITNFSDIHSANFEEGGVNLIDKYNKKLFNIYECLTAGDIADKEIPIANFNPSENIDFFILKLANSDTTSSINFSVDGENYPIRDNTTEDPINTLDANTYIVKYNSSERLFDICGIISSNGISAYTYDGDDGYFNNQFGLICVHAGATSALNYINGVLVHQNTEGFAHIPKGGTKGQILVNSGLGIAKWQDVDNATSSTAGFMSADDKAKLDYIEEGANKTVVDSVLSNTSTNPVQNKVVDAELANKADKSNVIPCYYAVYDGTDFTINADRDLSQGDLFFVKFSIDADMGTGGSLHIVYDSTTISGFMCGFDGNGLGEIKSDTIYLAKRDNKNNVLMQNMIVDSALDKDSTNAVENKVIAARLQAIENRLAALEGAN